MKKPFQFRLAYLLRLAACLLMLAAFAGLQHGRLLGRPVRTPISDDNPESPMADEPVAESSDGAFIVDSTELAPDVRGFAGPVPVEVEVRDGLVARVAPKLPNAETPGFFGMLESAGLWHAWDGLPVGVAATSHVDAVTSATFSSKAAIANVRAALAEAAHRQGEEAPSEDGTGEADGAEPTGIPVKTLAALAVLVAAAVIPLFVKSRRYRVVQLALDVAVLGLWSGLFLSTARLAGWMESGLAGGAEGIAALLMLAMAFLYPVFGRPAHYCMQVCPFGAAQELAGRLPVRKWKLPPKLVRGLTILRRVLWWGLMVSLVSGLWAGWMDWELFGAFAWRAVPPVVLALAVVFVILSAFVPRAYCRFVCPTGSLFKFTEGN